MDIISPNDFWRWAYSDFLSNAQRGVLAEYIVARALGCTDKGRVEWNAYDLVADGDLKVEVKSAAYLQSWKQKALSPIRFDIAHKRGWDAETNEYALEASRSADLYVFCVFSAQDRAFANPLDLDQWFFLACPTRLLDELFPKQKSVALSSLEAAKLQRVKYQSLGEHIRSLRATSSLQRTP